MTTDIWFGVHVPPEGRGFQEMQGICQSIETMGFDLFTITDHFMNMRNPEGSSNHPLECWTTLAGLAAVTNRIKLGPLVSCYGYRRPTVLAKMATTVDIISQGRLIMGLGAGWHEAEFRGFMDTFPSVPERLRGLRETIKICTQMFRHERTSYSGQLYHVDNVLNAPQPVQSPIPLMIGGGGEQVTLRLATRYADISHFFARNTETLDHKLEVLRRHCVDIGRSYTDIRKATSMNVLFQSSRGTGGDSSSNDVIKAIQDYMDRGIGLITFRFTGLENLQRLATEVLPQFRSR
jgi:F420-dependent oxidoreductase-like protein